MSRRLLIDESVYETRDWIDLFSIWRKNLICRNVGHIWYAVSWDNSTGVVVMECRRCYPHRDSIQRGVIYDLFDESDASINPFTEIIREPQPGEI